jgi:EAL and modified HD-GYP domain-containing signal transduction protein
MHAGSTSPAIGLEAGATQQDGLGYVTRQAILDSRGRVHGYDLLIRGGAEAMFPEERESATRTVLDQTVVYGLQRLTDGLQAFVACTERILTEYLVEVMLPSMTVLELRLVRELDHELLSVLKVLKAEGFRLALSGPWWQPEFDPAVTLADYLKVDFAEFRKPEMNALREKLRTAHASRVATFVETQEEFHSARSAGFTLFQGNFICSPELLRNGEVPANRAAQLHMLACLQNPTLDMHELAALVKLDTSLSYRILRAVNSSLFSMRQELTSIETALMVVGYDAVQRFVILALASELSAGAAGTRSAAVLQLSLARARFCELAAPLCGLAPTEQYMLGMLSLLPIMLRVAMSDLTPALPLRPAIREALHRIDNPERLLLNWLECFERAEWEECDAIAESRNLSGRRLANLYSQAVDWAGTMAKTLG